MEMREIKDKYNNGTNNINTSGRFKVKEKLFRYCWKCGRNLKEPSTVPFCCWECHQDFYKELAQDMDDIVGVN